MDVSPNTKANECIYPVCKIYKIPLTKPHVHKLIIKEFYQMNPKKRGTTSTMTANLGNSKRSSFVLVPQSHGYKRIKLYENIYKWFTKTIQALGGERNEVATCTNLFVHFSRK